MVKKVHVYGWDDEPVDERPSEFRSTGFPMSGYATTVASAGRARARTRFGFKSLIVFALLLLGIGAWALLQLPALLRH